ncbi:hypothetical protein [Microvirga pudoricolor]|uniref:hypothetical protein n=1 Tax=Microvirga pudoricolor TaxID=2778729 RepID=UPI001950A2B8|nr:hypothetical protein [Microvirga pudoricolor]MBM6596526.1 hypothetical protein [Microvirga pudoricolor]
MPKAYVLNEKLSNADREAIAGLLTQNGYSPHFGFPENLPALNPQVDIGVVCLPIDLSEQSSLQEYIQALMAAGIRVVSIWLHPADALPLGVEKFGSAAVAIDSPKVKEALQGEAIWEGASGEQRPQQPMTRNRC